MKPFLVGHSFVLTSHSSWLHTRSTVSQEPPYVSKEKHRETGRSWTRTHTLGAKALGAQNGSFSTSRIPAWKYVSIAHVYVLVRSRTPF